MSNGPLVLQSQVRGGASIDGQNASDRNVGFCIDGTFDTIDGFEIQNCPNGGITIWANNNRITNSYSHKCSAALGSHSRRTRLIESENSLSPPVGEERVKSGAGSVRSFGYAPMPSSNEPAASGKQRLSRTYWMPLALVASRSR
jgi:hypothetical protein